MEPVPDAVSDLAQHVGSPDSGRQRYAVLRQLRLLVLLVLLVAAVGVVLSATGGAALHGGSGGPVASVSLRRLR